MLENWPTPLKRAQIIIIREPAKNPTDVLSYRPISLLPIILNVVKKLLFQRINKDMNPHDWIPSHQSGFRQAHSTVQQCHRITDTTNKDPEDQQYCTAVFLDVSQASDKVWHPGLLYKIRKKTLPSDYYNLLKSYLKTDTSRQNLIMKFRSYSQYIQVSLKVASLAHFSIPFTHLIFQQPEKQSSAHLRMSTAKFANH
jgi:hypothetical protein